MDWSEMLPELLVVLAHKYIVYYEDYSSFARVCKSWHSAAVLATKGNARFPSLMLSETKGDEEFPKLSHISKETIPTTILAAKGNGPPSRLPSLMLSQKKGDAEFRDLFLLSNETIRKIRLPEVYGKLCMSSCGWLVTLGDDHAAHLINPLSREIINLPKIDTFPRFLETSEWGYGIRKLVFLAPSLVVVLWGCSGKLGFCRIGDKKWTHVDTGWHGTIHDITFYNGRVYCFDCNHHIRAWDVNYGEDPSQIVNISMLPKDVYDEHICRSYILGLDDDKRRRLFVVVREGMLDDTEHEHLRYDTYKTKSFQIWEYDLASGKWSNVKDLGSKALFVGFNSTFWMEEDPARVIKGNCIYFTDDVDVLYTVSKNGGGRDMGIYHISDGTIESHFTGESRSHLTPPIWLQSMHI